MLCFGAGSGGDSSGFSVFFCQWFGIGLVAKAEILTQNMIVSSSVFHGFRAVGLQVVGL